MKRQEKYPNTKWFEFFNANPKGRLTDDCVVRAMVKAIRPVIGISYEGALKMLYESSLESGYSVNSKQNFSRVFKKFGFVKMNQPKHDDNTKLTGKEFCEKFNKGCYICIIGGHHITAVVDGKIYDTWDCTDKTVGNYWIIG